ncbi:hypothetical protein FD724_38315 (plasmid) [Nostoc sp. C057]|uniref:hypothetical protein n=1 Tax=Nostoc sp. C057 TaxID=2576903 RepID=UPI0015C40108|nr:hypothetical protein [Nostoc sp. C057]QLE53713.1 hypothetical protein FD724_38315 [Nostoc sp. C057]
MAGKLGASQKKIIKHNYWSDRYRKTGDVATQLPVQSTTPQMSITALTILCNGVTALCLAIANHRFVPASYSNCY